MDRQEGDTIHLLCQCPQKELTPSTKYGTIDKTELWQRLVENSEATIQDEGVYMCISNHQGCRWRIPGRVFVIGQCPCRQVTLRVSTGTFPNDDIRHSCDNTRTRHNCSVFALMTSTDTDNCTAAENFASEPGPTMALLIPLQTEAAEPTTLHLSSSIAI